MDIIAFLSNDGEDFKGRRLSDIWSMSDQEIEATHDFIQIVFPLDEPSQSSFHEVYLGPEELKLQNQMLQFERLSSSPQSGSLGFFQGRLSGDQDIITIN